MAEEERHIIIPGEVPAVQQPQGEFVSQPAKLLRIASMIKEVLQDVRQTPSDEAGRKRLKDIYERAVRELRDGLSPDLQEELSTLTIPLEGTPSESEIRIEKGLVTKPPREDAPK